MKWGVWRQVHIHWFIVAFFTGIIFGIAASLFVKNVSIPSFSAIIIAVLLVAVALVKQRRVFIILMLLAGLLLGLVRGNIEQERANGYAWYYGQTLELSGTIVDDVTFGPDGNARYRLKDVRIGDRQMGGEVWVSSQAVELSRSDQVELSGFLIEGFGSFYASLVRAKVKNIVLTSSGDIGLQARNTFAEGTQNIIPEPERSLGIGFLLGLKSALPEALEQQIQILGLTHVVVASGYNLTILVKFARRVFEKVSKYLSTVFAASMIGGFILITGFSPSMSRAGLVAGMSLAAWYYGRKIHPLTLLIIAAAITLFIRPAYIWGDIGWYLSFTAFFGILVLAPLIHHYFWGAEKRPSYVRDLMVATFAAQLMTLPIILYSFGTFSVYALLANALILFIVPLCMLTTFVAGLAGLFIPLLAGVLALPAVLLLKYCTFVIEKLATLPQALQEFSITLPQLFIGYVLLLVTVLFLLKVTKHSFLKDKMIVD